MFRCPRCLYETPYKFNMKKHIFRKKMCSAVYSNISIEEFYIAIPDADYTRPELSIE